MPSFNDPSLPLRSLLALSAKPLFVEPTQIPGKEGLAFFHFLLECGQHGLQLDDTPSHDLVLVDCLHESCSQFGGFVVGLWLFDLGFLGL